MSKDQRLIETYLSPDPYLYFAKMTGLLRQDAVRGSVEVEVLRDRVKIRFLGTNYGMTLHGLVLRLGGDRELAATQLAEVFGFTERRLWTHVADLSGGERRRLQLLRLLAAEPNVLLLDEPTNDLDTDTVAALEDLLDTWPGTMVIASHDRYLVERVCDNVYALPGDGTLRHLPGGIEEYLNMVTQKAPTPMRTVRTLSSGKMRR